MLAHDIGGKGRTDAHRVAHQDVALQLSRLLWGDEDVLEGAEASGDAVNDLFLRDDLLDGSLCPPDACLRRVVQAQVQGSRRGLRHAYNLGDGKRLPVKH